MQREPRNSGSGSASKESGGEGWIGGGCGSDIRCQPLLRYHTITGARDYVIPVPSI